MFQPYICEGSDRRGGSGADLNHVSSPVRTPWERHRLLQLQPAIQNRPTNTQNVGQHPQRSTKLSHVATEIPTGKCLKCVVFRVFFHPSSSSCQLFKAPKVPNVSVSRFLLSLANYLSFYIPLEKNGEKQAKILLVNIFSILIDILLMLSGWWDQHIGCCSADGPAERLNSVLQRGS